MQTSTHHQPFAHVALAEEAVAPLSGSAQAVLNRLRFSASRCRVSTRQEYFATCTHLKGSAGASADAYVMSFLSVLNEALMKRAVFYKPGTKELSFDEAWLMSLIASAQRADNDSLAFLLHSRVAQDKRRSFLELIQGLAQSLVA